MIQEKIVTPEEIIKLLNQSKERLHPYYYRFSYLVSRKAFVANRIKKGEITTARTRKEFHTIKLDESNPMAKAFERLEQNKAKIQGLIYAEQ
ncbi:hypothetical protein ES705_15928 [subsurface metagenome]